MANYLAIVKMVAKITKMTYYCRKIVDLSTLQKMVESRIAKWLTRSQNDSHCSKSQK
jgi:hypothetical protein